MWLSVQQYYWFIHPKFAKFHNILSDLYSKLNIYDWIPVKLIGPYIAHAFTITPFQWQKASDTNVTFETSVWSLEPVANEVTSY